MEWRQTAIRKEENDLTRESKTSATTTVAKGKSEPVVEPAVTRPAFGFHFRRIQRLTVNGHPITSIP
jgi:hypothetical protein